LDKINVELSKNKNFAVFKSCLSLQSCNSEL